MNPLTKGVAVRVRAAIAGCVIPFLAFQTSAGQSGRLIQFGPCRAWNETGEAALADCLPRPPGCNLDEELLAVLRATNKQSGKSYPANGRLLLQLSWPQTASRGTVKIRLEKVRIAWVDGADGRYSYSLAVSSDTGSWPSPSAGTSATSFAYQDIPVTGDVFSADKFVRLSFGATGARIAWLEWWGSVVQEGGYPFAHPGGFLNREEILRIRDGVSRGVEPWKSAFAAGFSNVASGAATPGFTVCPDGVGAGVGDDYNDIIDPDYPNTLACNLKALYPLALYWAATGDERYARSVVEWIGQMCDSVAAVRNETGFTIRFAFVTTAAAEIVRMAASWNGAVEARFKQWLHDVVLKWCNSAQYYGRLDAATSNHAYSAMQAALAAAIFLDEPYNLNRVAELMRRSIRADLTEWGQHYETCRDIPHGIYHSAQLVDIPEMLWHQGIDVYSAADRRIATAVEYHAALTLGRKNQVHELNSGGDWGGRCFIWDEAWECSDCAPSMFEIGYNHFHNRLGMAMPNAAELLATWRPIRRVSDPAFGFTLGYPGSGPRTDPLEGWGRSSARQALPAATAHRQRPPTAALDLRGRRVADRRCGVLIVGDAAGHWRLRAAVNGSAPGAAIGSGHRTEQSRRQ